MIRVLTVSPKEVQRYAARALLLHKRGPTSYEDLCTIPGINGQPDETFRDEDGELDYVTTAQRLKLLSGDHILHEVLLDASVELPNLRRLQSYFATLIFHQNPTNAKELFDNFLDRMYIPRPNFNNLEVERNKRKQKVLGTETYIKLKTYDYNNNK